MLRLLLIALLIGPGSAAHGAETWFKLSSLLGPGVMGEELTEAGMVLADEISPGPELRAATPLNDDVFFLSSQAASPSDIPLIFVQDAAESSSGGGEGDLAAQSQNPISDLVSLPLQNNWDFNVQPAGRTRYIGNLQPVVPVKLNDDWNFISRAIVPFVNVPLDDDMRMHGIGDMLGQFYFSPRTSGPFIWGVGPAVLFPTASAPEFGFGEWGAGVNAVGLISTGPIVAGTLVYQIWGAEGDTKPFLVQPFFNYNLPEGWFLNVSGEANADWELPSEDRWSFPFGGGIGRVFPLFGQPLNVLARFAPYLEQPTGGPDWQFRLAVTLLFPK